MTVADVLDGIDAHIDRAGSRIRRDRHIAAGGIGQCGDAYAELGQARNERNRSRIRLVGVDNGVDIRTLAEDMQDSRCVGRGLAGAFDDIAVDIHDDHIILDHLLIHHAGRRGYRNAGTSGAVQRPQLGGGRLHRQRHR